MPAPATVTGTPMRHKEKIRLVRRNRAPAAGATMAFRTRAPDGTKLPVVTFTGPALRSWPKTVSSPGGNQSSRGEPWGKWRLGWGTMPVTARENPSSRRGSSWQRTGQRSLETHEVATAAWSPSPRTWLTATTTKADFHQRRTGRRPCPPCGQRGWSRSPAIGSAAGLMFPLVRAWRETPHFRHWRKW